MIKILPGLIDIHVHLRDPGQTQKEDFYTGTAAALAGGFTAVLDMPNNLVAITSADSLQKKIEIAKQKTVCDIGFYFGSLGDNLEEFGKVKNQVFGLKLYLSLTTGGFILDSNLLEKVYSSWPNELPILTHAEGEMIDKVIEIVRITKKKTHIVHVSSRYELERVIQAKKEGLPITFGVTPHHLFLSFEESEKLGSFGKMKPPIERGYNDFMWQNLKYIDVIESDHAPHTKMEKESDNPPFGVPGLETTLPFLLTAVAERKLTIERVIELCHINPAKIFNIPVDLYHPEGDMSTNPTRVEVDLDEEYVIQKENLKTKCGWSPFEGRRVKGKVKRVFLRGKKVFEDGKILVKPGSGRVIEPINN